MRYLPLTEENRNEMLDTIGIEKVDELFSDVPSDIELNPKFIICIYIQPLNGINIIRNTHKFSN